jgi:PKD domain
MNRTLTALAALVALGLALAGCESTPLTADPEGELKLSANPTTVVIDTSAGETDGQTSILAQVLDSAGFPMQDVAVTFLASGGALQSSAGGTPVAVQTNANGVAVDVLTLDLQDPASIEVGASSGALSQTVTITKSVSAGNTPPSAVMAVEPQDGQVKGQTVTFDGRGSSDPDGSITCYQWTIDSNLNGSDEVIQGATESVVSRTYATEQRLTITLRVSDDADAGTTFCAAGAGTAPPSRFSANTDFVSGYEIACAIVAPQALAGADQVVSAGGGSVIVQLTGTAVQRDAAIVGYSWDCANGTPPQTGQAVSCTYTNQNAPNNTTYTAEFRVTDACGLVGTDRVNIVVTP